MLLLSRIAALLVLLTVPLLLSLASQALAGRPGAPEVPSEVIAPIRGTPTSDDARD